MGRKLIVGLAVLLSLLAAQVQSARATTFLRLESSYLGDGWFQYHVTEMKDPFFDFQIVYGLYLRFTNEIDQMTASADWVHSNEVTQVGWTWSGNYAPTVPYDFVVLNRSSEPAYRLGVASNFDGGIITMGISYRETYFGGSMGVSAVGFAMVPCLVPCSRDEADNSPTNFVYDMKLIPDVAIDRLIQTNGHIYGVDFNWYTNSTFLLQGTANFIDWTNIAYIWSTPPRTIWTTNQPLDSYGQFYRLAMKEYYSQTNTPPLSASLVNKTTAARQSLALPLPRVTSCVPIKGKMQVNIVANTDGRYTVQALTADRQTVFEKNVEVKGATGSVMFDAAKLPTPVFFQVLAR